MNKHLSMLALALSLALHPLLGADIYVRPNAGTYGNGNGSDWTNAFSGMPDDEHSIWSQVGAGDTIYVAGGTYTTNWQIEAGGSSSARLSVLRATVAEHGTDVGWQSSFDSQALLNAIDISVWDYNYITIDGAEPEGLKIKLWESSSINSKTRGIYLTPGNDHSSSHITLRNILIEGNMDSGGDTVVNGQVGISCTPRNANEMSDILIEKCKIYRLSSTAVQVTSVDDFVIQDCEFGYFDDNDHHENYVWMAGCDNMVIRNNRMYNTAAEGVFFRNSCSNSKVYGNLFYTTSDFHGGQTGYGVASKGADSYNKNIYVYNNTFVNVYYAVRFLPLDSQMELYNNIFYNCRAVDLSQTSHDYNSYYECQFTVTEPNGQISSGNPFVNLSTNDFRLKAASLPGKSLGSPYNRDMFDALRGGDGIWDRGALEYTGIAIPAPDAPKKLRIIETP
jgi:hypothetical protein